MDNVIGQQISSHLEFLGYEIEDRNTPELCAFNARALNRTTLRINISKENTVYISALYVGWDNKSLDNLEFHNAIHKANSNSNFAKWYPRKVMQADKETFVIQLVIEFLFPSYEKKSFGIFISGFLNDITKTLPELQKFQTT